MPSTSPTALTHCTNFVEKIRKKLCKSSGMWRKFRITSVKFGRQSSCFAYFELCEHGTTTWLNEDPHHWSLRTPLSRVTDDCWIGGAWGQRWAWSLLELDHGELHLPPLWTAAKVSPSRWGLKSLKYQRFWKPVLQIRIKLIRISL